MRILKEIVVEPKQPFVVDRFRETDALGVANLFLSVYGDGYPFDMYYYPEQIAAANAAKDVLSVVARTPKGDIIGHGALYKSFPENPQTYELGQLIILDQYRGAFAAFKITQYIKQNIVDIDPPECLFGEAVTNRLASQKLLSFIGLSESAIEIDLMPESMYVKSEILSGRVSCLIQCLINSDATLDIFLHPRCKDIMELVFPDLKAKRNIYYRSHANPADARTSIMGKSFPQAGVSRYNIIKTGADAASVIDAIISKSEQDSIKITQFILNASDPFAIEAFNLLFKKGFFCGGWLPLWFQRGDGFLLQGLKNEPNFKEINLFSKKSEELLELIKKDYGLSRK